jgi:hypothetical protein
MKLFTKIYYGTAAVQFYENVPGVCGDTIRWLETVSFSWKDYPFIGNKNYYKALNLKLDELNSKYPEYNGYVGIY